MEKTKYSSAKSELIKTKIKETDWTNRQYIDDLLLLKVYLEKGADGFVSAMQFHQLKNKYQQEFLTLSKEISNNRFLQAQEELQSKNQELEKLALLKKLQEEKELEDWRQGGGKF